MIDLKNCARFSVLIVLIVFAGIIAGCSKTSQDTKPSNQPPVGIIDMQTAIKNHPKYTVLQQATREYDALAAEIEAAVRGREAGSSGAALPAPLDGAAGLNDAAAQEFNAKMTARENELRVQLEAAASQVHQQLAAEMDSYVRELDKDYQPQIFSLQLKQKTVQLSQEEAAAVQTELERLQKERSGKIASKQQELSQKMDGIMAGKQAEAKKQLEAYGQQLNTTIGSELAARQAQLAPGAAFPADSDGRTEKEQQLAMKKQEVSVLQETIVNDIRDKTAKVAAEKGLAIVFADVQSNISAVDITTAVIGEFNK